LLLNIYKRVKADTNITIYELHGELRSEGCIEAAYVEDIGYTVTNNKQGYHTQWLPRNAQMRMNIFVTMSTLESNQYKQINDTNEI